MRRGWPAAPPWCYMKTDTWIRLDTLRRLPAVFLAVLVAATALFGACRGPLAAGADAVVATVNGQPVLESAVHQALLHDYGARTLARMIDEELVRQAAQVANLNPDPAQLELKMETALSRAGGEVAFEQSLAVQGLTRDEYRDRLALSLLLDLLALQVTTFSDEQIQAYYQAHRERFSYGEQARARLILTSTRENAETLRSALAEGGDFAGLAQAFSEDPATRDKGGDMGWFERADFAPELSQVAFALRPGELSQVFQGPDGYYLLQVSEKRPAGQKPLESVREEILSDLRYRELPSARQRWIEQARRNVQIRIADPDLAAALRIQLQTAPPLGDLGLIPHS